MDYLNEMMEKLNDSESVMLHLYTSEYSDSASQLSVAYVKEDGGWIEIMFEDTERLIQIHKESVQQITKEEGEYVIELQSGAKFVFDFED